MSTFFRIALLALCLVVDFVKAAEPEALELVARYERLHVDYVLDADGRRTETREMAVKVLAQQAVEYVKQTSISYSTSVERTDVLEAYTRKTNGRRIEAPKSNYQVTINKGREDGSPAISDRTTLTVLFPDVSVGDVTVLKYRVTETEPMFPGQFSVNERFNRMVAYDDVKIRIDAPATLRAYHATTAMTQVANETQGGRHILEWNWKNPRPVKSKRRNYSVFTPDKEPGYSFSTFNTYGELAEAYGKRARPKAAVTQRLRELADVITKDSKDPREQARQLYEWVATNIHYAGNCVGVGAVVPRDPSFVLENRMGDCKDQATLLQGLLAAKGIKSTQALVNSGSTYQLPKVPVISMVNHVIVYVPSLDLYLDPTSGTTPFGMLPMSDSDKPVLLVDGYKDGMRTPPVKSNANRQHAKSTLTVKPDGSVAGVIEVSTTGVFAVTGRDRLRLITAQQKTDFLDNLYRRNNRTGFGRLESDDPRPLRNSFSYKVTFETEEFAQVPGPGAFAIAPLYATEAPIYMVLLGMEEEPEAEETACIGGTMIEEYVYKLPAGMKILAVPKDVALASGLASYRSTYSHRTDTLTVRREFIDKTDRNICAVSLQREFAEMARKIAADLKSQVIYQ